MTDRTPGPRLLVSTPITDRIERLGKEADDFERRWGDDVRATALRYAIAEVQDAMREAEEAWRPLIETAALTGWSEDTLQSHAKAQKDGARLPHHWRGLESRMTPSGYVFRVSSVPQKPARAG